jgi:hypothetical protein
MTHAHSRRYSPLVVLLLHSAHMIGHKNSLCTLCVCVFSRVPQKAAYDARGGVPVIPQTLCSCFTRTVCMSACVSVYVHPRTRLLEILVLRSRVRDLIEA